MADNKMLSLQEKRKLASCFDLSLLSQDDREFFYSILYNHLDEFPILTMLAKDVMNGSNKKIFINVKKLDSNINGYQGNGEICFSTQLWHSCKQKKDTKRAASTFWHEIMHAIQQDKLTYSYSKRGYMVYRQFIEAEAMSYSNLMVPRCEFEDELYKSILKDSPSKFEAQKRYIAVSTRLRLNADRELAKFDAQNIMGKYFSESKWEDSEKYTIKGWRDFYYKYHQDYAKNIWETKGSYDNKLISESEKYFEDRYGIKISAKAAISEDVINNYGLSTGILNTRIIKLNDAEVFEISKWRELSDRHGNKAYTLDMPNMDPSYINDVYGHILANGIHVKKTYAIHRDGFSSRLLQIVNTPENIKKFIEKCETSKQPKVREDIWPKPDERKCGYGKQIFNNAIIAIDVENPPIFQVGKYKNISVDFNEFLSPKNKKFLKEGGLIFVGKHPDSLAIDLPKEVMDKACKYCAFKESDPTVSRLQGYLFVDREGFLCYKECSTNGSFVQRGNPNRLNQCKNREQYSMSTR